MISLGPIEMIELAGKDKISLTILSDETVCQRNYASIGADITKTGEEYTQTTFANSDFTSAFDKIQQLLTDYESAGYITQEQMSLGKRPAAVPAPAIEEKKKNKRETKADGKTTEATRKSSRLVAQPVKVVAESESSDVGSGAITVMLAQTYDPDQHDPTGWSMSEKMDGVRCYWNGKRMYTRNANQIYAPKEWLAQLPTDVAIDGELWSGRDNFQSIVSTVRKHEPEPEKWKEIKFMVFDGPLIKGNFQQRLKVLESKIAKDNKVVQLIKQTKCKSRAHLEEYMDEVCGKKGEGVMIKDLKSKYEHRRSYSLLKVKRFEDAEATVIGHNKGTGRCADMCGAIVVKEKDGTTFKIGSGFDDAQRRCPPKKGTVVTFKFQGRSKGGTPRFPIFLRVHPGM